MPNDILYIPGVLKLLLYKFFDTIDIPVRDNGETISAMSPVVFSHNTSVITTINDLV